MKKTRTGSPAGEALASPPVATVQVPLPLLDVLTDTRTAFFGLCLETGEQVRMARALGCGFAQGFHFSRPVPVPQVEGLLERPMPAFA